MTPPTDETRDLDALRAALSDLDREILERIARRLTLAQRIGQAKQAAGLPTRDYAQEKTVLERAVAIAGETGLALPLARRLLRTLIEASLTVQERDRVVRRAHGEGRRALVIGGAGRMGGWMAGFLASQGFDVTIADPAVGAEDERRVADWHTLELDHDVVVVAAPLRATAAILDAMAARPPRGLLFDVGSLKSPLRGSLARLVAVGARVTSVHPMFGPSTELLSDRHVVFVDVGVPEATAQARALFDVTMAIPVTMDIDAHDRLAAWVLGLSHALNIAFFTALAHSGQTARALARLSSTTFDAQLATAAAVAGENPGLYFEIQALNDHGAGALDALHEAVTALRAAVVASDETAFRDPMARGQDYLATIAAGKYDAARAESPLTPE